MLPGALIAVFYAVLALLGGLSAFALVLALKGYK